MKEWREGNSTYCAIIVKIKLILKDHSKILVKNSQPSLILTISKFSISSLKNENNSNKIISKDCVEHKNYWKLFVFDQLSEKKNSK